MFYAVFYAVFFMFGVGGLCREREWVDITCVHGTFSGLNCEHGMEMYVIFYVSMLPFSLCFYTKQKKKHGRLFIFPFSLTEKKTMKQKIHQNSKHFSPPPPPISRMEKSIFLCLISFLYRLFFKSFLEWFVICHK